jgi:hypothetical protein
MADWLDEWPGGPSYPRNAARFHAAFIRSQLGSGYKGGLRVVKGVFGRDAAACQKMWFGDTVKQEPWLGGCWRAVVNTTGCGVYYKGGLPEAIKCDPTDLASTAELVALWRIPHVCCRVGMNDMGVAYMDGPAGRRSEHAWMRSPHGGPGVWVSGADLPDDGHRAKLVIEITLAKVFAESCMGAQFHAIDRRRWRSHHPC